VRTGEVSGLVVLDIDNRPNAYGLATLEEMAWDGRVPVGHPETLTAHTPSGGLHVFFAHPGFPVSKSAGQLGHGLDVRGNGGSTMGRRGPAASGTRTSASAPQAEVWN
jgi:hypothetical protein